MRLWHQVLIPRLPRAQLLGQHRELCALRGSGWRKPHSTVNYVFGHPYWDLYVFHILVMDEMARRGYRAKTLWRNPHYRGRVLGMDYSVFTDPVVRHSSLIYPEHGESYLAECLDNLAGKGIYIPIPIL